MQRFRQSMTATATVWLAVVVFSQTDSSSYGSQTYDAEEGWSISTPDLHSPGFGRPAASLPKRTTRTVRLRSSSTDQRDTIQPARVDRSVSNRRWGRRKTASSDSPTGDVAARPAMDWIKKKVGLTSHTTGEDVFDEDEANMRAGGEDYDLPAEWIGPQGQASEDQTSASESLAAPLPPESQVTGKAAIPRTHELFNAKRRRRGSADSRPDYAVNPAAYSGPGDYDAPPYGGGCYDGTCCDSGCCDVGCCDTGCCDVAFCDPCVNCGCNPCSCPPRPMWAVGWELVIVKPRFDDNVAYTLTESDAGGVDDVITDVEFDFDREATGRIWMGYQFCSGFGAQATYWHFNRLGTSTTAQPPANGFGLISHPPFGHVDPPSSAVDISTSIPDETFTASAFLEAFTVDLELTKRIDMCKWSLTTSGGLRYAEIQQAYRARTFDINQVLRGEIIHSQVLKGIGPTLALHISREINCNLRSFGIARGSLLFGDGESEMISGEDLNTTTPLSVSRSRGRDDFLPIGELQIGLHWQRPRHRCRGCQPFFIAAMETQIWGGAGNSSGEDGNVGFFGTRLGTGLIW